MKKSSKNDSRVFVNITVSFLFFIIVPILVLNIIAWQAIKITGDNERLECIRLLSGGRDQVDNFIRNCQNEAYLIRNDSSLSALEKLKTPLAAQDYYYIWQALQSIKKLELGSRGISMMLYYSSSDLVLSPTFNAGKMINVYGSLYKFDGCDFPAFLRQFLTASSGPVIFPEMDYIWESEPMHGILYRMKLGLNGNNYLFCLLPGQKLLDIFSSILNQNDPFYIYDSEGNRIFSSGGNTVPAIKVADLDGESGLLPDGFFGPGFLGVYSRSPYGLVYVSSVNENTALRHMRNLQNLTLVLNITAAALSLGYAFFLAARNLNRIKETIRLLHENPALPSYSGGNIFSYLNLSVERLACANTILRRNADSGRKELRNAFFSRIISGGWDNPKEIYAAAKQADITTADKFFCIIILLSDKKSGKENTVLSENNFGSCLEMFTQSAGGNPEMPAYSRSRNSLDLLFSFDRERLTQFRGDLENLFPVNENAAAGFYIAGSGPQEDICGLANQYRLCREYTLICNDRQNTGIRWVDMLQLPFRHILIFPIETEQRLLNQLQSGNSAGATASIHELFRANLWETRLAESMLLIFYTTLQGCLLRALEGNSAEQYRGIIQSLDFRRHPDNLEKDFLTLAEGICEFYTQEKSRKNITIKKEELTEFVETHFSEEQLSLGLAAAHFGFSETYFSKMFREITGENFSTFTEITRLNKARDYLKQYLKIEEVAYRCGYKSPNTFRRAYKRYFGINPAQSR
ncbi:MAG: helix-turn-helix transcriptional regulator [Treponema sp.]|nr:helix-turn-helix transcriptional regulator [Treponema sp.]